MMYLTFLNIYEFKIFDAPNRIVPMLYGLIFYINLKQNNYAFG